MTTNAATPAEVRANAKALRQRIERGDTLTLEEARAACVTRPEALSVFDRCEDDGDFTVVFCCGDRTNMTDGIFGSKVECPRCGAKAVDATSPMWSPFLERGNSYLTMPSREWLDAFADKTWLVMHEGNR